MNKQIFENIYNSSIESIIEKFISSTDDFFLTEKDLHFYFFYSCLHEDSFEYRDKLLIHTEYPMPFKATTKDKSNPIKTVEDNIRAMRPHIDSVLLNRNFIELILNKGDGGEITDDWIDDCIRGLRVDSFPNYIGRLRDIYEKFYYEHTESVLSHSLEFKFVRAGGEGIKAPIDGIQYDLKKLLLIAEENNRLKVPFSEKCTLLVFIGERGNKKIITELNKLEKEKIELFSKFKRAKDNYSDNKERYVIRYDFRK